MANPDGVIRSICWRDLCPWTELFRLFRIAVSIQLLLLGFIGAWAMTVGWQITDQICLNDESRADPVVAQYLQAVTIWPRIADGSQSVPITENGDLLDTENSPASDAPSAASPISRLWQQLIHTPLFAMVEPVRQLFDGSNGWREFFFFMIGGFWNLIVWSIVGGAITRIAAVRLGRDERVGLRDSLVFATSKLGSYVGAPLVPLIAISVIAVPLFVLGLVMRLNVGVLLGGLLWGLVGVAGFTMTLFAVGVLFGWPLMWSAISSEGSDAFDAISRSFAYTYQRPLHYLFYATLAFTLGVLGWLIVHLFCNAVVQFSMLSVGAGMGAGRFEAVQAAMSGVDSEAPRMIAWGTAVADWFNRCFLGFQTAYAYSFLWTAAAGIYLLLRRDADQTEMDEVYIAEDESVAYGLPPIKMDESGIPVVDDADSAPKTHPSSDPSNADQETDPPASG